MGNRRLANWLTGVACVLLAGMSAAQAAPIRFAVAHELGDFLRHPRGGELGLFKNDDGNVLPLGCLQRGGQSILVPGSVHVPNVRTNCEKR